MVDLALKSKILRISDAIFYLAFGRGNSQVSGSVHSHITHLYALLETAKEIGVLHIYIQFFGDGRDTAPRSGAGHAKDLIALLDREKYGEIATVVDGIMLW